MLNTMDGSGYVVLAYTCLTREAPGVAQWLTAVQMLMLKEGSDNFSWSSNVVLDTDGRRVIF
jgi:hypothetical protein